MTQAEINEAINAQESVILDREAKLTATDYIAAKIAEGKATKAEYAAKIAERQQWRDDINAAQEEIERLDAMEPEGETPTPEAEM
jgi:hypothetical protein